MKKNTTICRSNLLPLDTLVDVVATHKKTGQKTVKKMSLSEYYNLTNKDYRYQAYQIGFLKK